MRKQETLEDLLVFFDSLLLRRTGTDARLEKRGDRRRHKRMREEKGLARWQETQKREAQIMRSGTSELKLLVRPSMRGTEQIVGEGGKPIEDLNLETMSAYLKTCKRPEGYQWDEERFSRTFGEWVKTLPPEVCGRIMRPVTLEDVNNALRKIRHQTFADVDASVARNLTNKHLLILASTYSTWLREGKIPKDHNWLVQVGIPKVSGECTTEQLRPLGVYSLVYAMFDLIMADRLGEVSCCLAESIVGFRPGGTQHFIILSVLGMIMRGFTKRMNAGPVYVAVLDKYKAYDQMERLCLYWTLKRLGLDLYARLTEDEMEQVTRHIRMVRKGREATMGPGERGGTQGGPSLTRKYPIYMEPLMRKMEAILAETHDPEGLSVLWADDLTIVTHDWEYMNLRS
jgi:hypothetical protein